MPRGTIVVLLVLLGAGLAAWLLLAGPEPATRGPSFGGADAVLDDTPGEVALATSGHAASIGGTSDGKARAADAGPWTLGVQVEGPDGSPVSGAHVHVRTGSDRESTPLGAVDVAHVRTGPDGRAHVGGLPTPSVGLVVTAPGFAPSWRRVSLPPPGAETTLHRIRLWPPRTVLRITVRKPDGSPVPGARVFVHGGYDGAPLQPPPVLTDALGQAEAPLGTWGFFEVVVHAAGYLAFRLGASTSTLEANESLDVSLQPAREVSGQFVAEGHVRVPTDLGLTLRTQAMRPDSPATAWVERAPGADGRFRLWASPDEAEALLKLSVDSPSHGPLGTHDVDLTKPTTDLRIDLTPMLRRLGTHTLFVEHADGRPARGLRFDALVSLTNGGRIHLEGALDGIGRAQLPWPSDAKELDTLLVRDALGIRHRLRARDQIDGVWSLGAYGTAHGFVAEPGGSRPETAVVGFYPSDRQDTGRFQPVELGGAYWRPCDARGEFTCAGLAPGRYYVMSAVDSSALPPALDGLPLIEAKAGEVTEVGTVTLAARRVVSGRVVDARGRPVRGIAVWATVSIPRGTVWSARDETDEEGAFQLEIGREGSLRVHGNDPRWTSPYVRSSVSPEEPIEITLADTPVLIVRFERRTPPDGASAKLCLSPVGEPQTHAVGGTILGHELRVHLPANLEADTAYEAWIECGDYLGDITPLPTDLSGPGPHVITMWTRLPEDDDE